MLIGDNNQLDPVSAGNTFNEFIKEHAGKTYTTILSEISRQKKKKLWKWLKPFLVRRAWPLMVEPLRSSWSLAN